MSKDKMQTSLWAGEIERLGLVGCLRDRLIFHGGLNAQVTADATGAGLQTIRRHMRALVNHGLARYTKPNNEDWIAHNA